MGDTGSRSWSVALAMALFLAGVSPAIAASIEWPTLADVEVVKVVTANPDGSQRETKVWLVVVDGQGYLRTGGTRWYGNVERDPRIVLRVGEDEHPLRAALVVDSGVVERVQAAFREKYGWEDRVVGWFRFGPTRIMRLEPREAAGD